MKKLLKTTLLTIVLASMPVTLYAIYTDSYFQTIGYGSIGGAPIFSGSCTSNLAVGFNNLFTNSVYSAAIGQNLQNYNSYSTVVGQYNTPTSGALFIVGNGTGTSSSLRKNGMEVLLDGTVKFPVAPAPPAANPTVTIGTASTAVTTVTTKIYGTADIARIPAKGGISMGAYQ